MNKIRKSLAFVLALILLVGMVPEDTPAAAKVAFSKTRTNVYDNGVDKGEYVYTIKNVSKGQTVKWSVSGAGKKFVKLKYSKRTITGKTTSNRIYIKTNEDVASKNAKFKLTAKVYSKKGALVQTVSTTSKIKSVSKTLMIVSEALGEEVLPTGVECMFGTEITPVNCTDTVKWTVQNSNGEDVSSYISQDGEFQADVPGIYTITATTYSGNTKRKTASQTIEVADMVTAVEQTEINSFGIKFSTNIGSRFDLSKVYITGSDNSIVKAKESKTNSDGTVRVTTYTNFADGVTYTVKYGGSSESFVASAGVPATLQIVTNQVTVDKPTEIEYKLLDKNGFDVTSLYPGTIEYTPDLKNGIIDENNKILMKTVGASGTIDAVFTPTDRNVEKIAGRGVVVCVGVTSGTKSNFTITSSTNEPDYSMLSYKDERNIYLGTTGYVHFRALGADGDPIKYESVTYTPLDPESLIIQKSGKVIPIKAQTVTVLVTAKLPSGVEHSYNYDVTIKEAPVLTSVQLDQNIVEVSNLNSSDNRQYIRVSGLDQSQTAYELVNESVQFVRPTSASAPTVSYDADKNRIEIDPSGRYPGRYDYQISVSVGGKSVSTSFSIVVSAVPTTGINTYKVLLDDSTVDVALNSSTKVADQTTNLRVARYINNVFTGYQTFSVTSITKDGKYYGRDLTTGGYSNVQSISNVSKAELITRRMTAVSATSCNCAKAEAGTYVIEVSYYRSDISSYMKETVAITVTDSTAEVAAIVDRTTSTEVCKTALELAKNCISVKNGEITECTLIGEDKPGSQVLVVSKELYYIQDVTVTTTTNIAGGMKANEVYKVQVGKTLTNK